MTPRKLNNSHLFFQICFSIPYFFSAIGKAVEGRLEIVHEDTGCMVVMARFIARRGNNRRGKAAGLHRRGKKV
jgi:hypothetical protein